MRKIILTAIFIIATITATKAQDVRFGIKGGVNFANVSFNLKSSSNSASVNTKGKTSFYAGVLVEFPLSSISDKVYFETGAIYSKNGNDINKEASRFNAGAFSIDQINIPILMKYELIENAFIKGGLYGGFIVSASGLSTADNVNLDITDKMNTLDYGLSIGAEYNLDNGLFFDAMYNIGLANLPKKEESNLDGNTDVTLKNRFFQVGVGYKF